jgi:hypothetical protein
VQLSILKLKRLIDKLLDLGVKLIGARQIKFE